MNNLFVLIHNFELRNLLLKQLAVHLQLLLLSLRHDTIYKISFIFYIFYIIYKISISFINKFNNLNTHPCLSRGSVVSTTSASTGTLLDVPKFRFNPRLPSFVLD